MNFRFALSLNHFWTFSIFVFYFAFMYFVRCLSKTIYFLSNVFFKTTVQ